MTRSSYNVCTITQSLRPKSYANRLSNGQIEMNEWETARSLCRTRQAHTDTLLCITQAHTHKTNERTNEPNDRYALRKVINSCPCTIWLCYLLLCVTQSVTIYIIHMYLKETDHRLKNSVNQNWCVIVSKFSVRICTRESPKSRERVLFGRPLFCLFLKPKISFAHRAENDTNVIKNHYIIVYCILNLHSYVYIARSGVSKRVDTWHTALIDSRRDVQRDTPRKSTAL